jgi:regulator of CtrA degradation
MSERGLNTVSFAGHVAASSQFKNLYADGMGLVEETASYLDGPGRQAAKVLPRMASVLYAAESMRLTTRLMQMASWLLLQRAVNNGEMTRDQVLSEKSKVRLDSFNVDRAAPGWNDLPEAFRDLVERSLRLQNRVALLDREVYRPQEAQNFVPDNQNSVQAQLHLLQTAFGNN